MFVVDNFINNESSNLLEDKLSSNSFPWYFNNGINYSNDLYFQFTHMLYENGSLTSDFFNLATPILSKLNIKNLIRVKCNLLTKTDSLVHHGYHNDYTDKYIYSCVYYVNTNNGFTTFKNYEPINSIKNRCSVFKSTEEHSSTSCTDKKIRLVININFIPNDIEKIFS